MTSPAQRHRLRVLAAKAAGTSAAAAGVAGPAPETGPAATAYEQQLAQLAEDRRTLKALQSRERKVELKRQLLPKYGAWVQGVLDGARATGRAVQDLVVATVMVWRIDTGDYAGALQLAEHVLRFGLALPEQYERDAATVVTEEISEAALAALSAGGRFDLEVLTDVELLTADHDMPDEVRAKLHKAIGLELARSVTEQDAANDNVAGGSRARQEAALQSLRRALELNERAGVKKDIERLERELKKSAGDPAS